MATIAYLAVKVGQQQSVNSINTADIDLVDCECLRV